MYFEIRPTGPSWEWVLLSEADEVLAESHRTFPSPAIASAAALAWAQLVHRAGRALSRPPGGLLV